MPKFKVTVEKRMYASGIVEVTAKNPDEAIKIVRRRIDTGDLLTSDIAWDDPQYEDSSFDATGDVD